MRRCSWRRPGCPSSVRKPDRDDAGARADQLERVERAGGEAGEQRGRDQREAVRRAPVAGEHHRAEVDQDVEADQRPGGPVVAVEDRADSGERGVGDERQEHDGVRPRIIEDVPRSNSAPTASAAHRNGARGGASTSCAALALVADRQRPTPVGLRRIRSGRDRRSPDGHAGQDPPRSGDRSSLASTARDPCWSAMDATTVHGRTPTRRGTPGF